MDVDREQWTHEEVVVSARVALVEELAIEESPLAEAFLKSPIGPRVRVGGVRQGLARLAAEQLAAIQPDSGIRFGGYVEPSDEVTLLLPAEVNVRPGLKLPVMSHCH
jgi:hypothetical protein